MNPVQSKVNAPHAASQELRKTQQRRKNICAAVTGAVAALLFGWAYPHVRVWQDERIYNQIKSLAADPTTHADAVSLVRDISSYSPGLFKLSAWHVLKPNHASYVDVAVSLVNLGQAKQEYLDDQLLAHTVSREFEKLSTLLTERNYAEAELLAATMPTKKSRELALVECRDHYFTTQYASRFTKHITENNWNWDQILVEAAMIPHRGARASAYEFIFENLIDQISLTNTTTHLRRAIKEATEINVDQWLAQKALNTKTPDLIIPFISDRDLWNKTIAKYIAELRLAIDSNPKTQDLPIKAVLMIEKLKTLRTS